ncbi:MAG TPA: carboxypeptidase-like regulatory domain-containing protein [Candidatus Kapabacteria bacterium]|nr:carboxypeptidase-like regulatory domain-containing protein [Candidatus Kapabacteria bacterium]
MNAPLLLRVLLVLGVLVATGCERDDDDDPVSPNDRTGAIVGIVQLIDSGQYARYHAGVTVSISGTAHVATSDSTGRWIMTGVPAGVYTFELSKPGYTRDYLVRQQVVGRDTLFVWPRNQPNGGNFTIQPLPPYRIDSFSVRTLPADGARPAVLRVDGSITPKVPGPMVTVLIGASSAVSWRLSAYRYTWQVLAGPAGSIAAEIDLAWLRSHGFASGSTVYVIAYPGGASKDYDWVTDRYLFKDLVDEPTAVTSVVIP